MRIVRTRIILWFVIMSAVAGCASVTSVVRPVAETQVLVSKSQKSQELTDLNRRGEEAIAQLKSWYDSVTEDCGGPDKPSYLCSGVEMRATDTVPEYLPWDPSQKHLDKGAIAFSWVRRDTNFGRPAERSNGFLFPPLQAIPEGKISDLQVLCTFPTDGGTDNRETANGCGPQRGFESTTDACQKVGVGDASAWLEKYSEDDIRRSRFCGWDLREEPQNMKAQWFEMPIKARAGLGSDAWMGYNEILLPVWKVGVGADLPLHAFFYVEGMPKAGLNAQYDQVRYHAAYAQSIPVVRIKFPTSQDQTMVFTYAEEDQSVGRPVPTTKIDFESENVGDRKEFVIDGVTFIVHGSGGISNDAQGGLISGKHVAFEGAVELVLPGAGRRKVSYHWGCDDHCIRDGLLTDNYKVLKELPEQPGMSYGTDEFVVDGPEIVTLYIGEEGDGRHMVMDNLEVTEVPDN